MDGQISGFRRFHYISNILKKLLFKSEIGVHKESGLTIKHKITPKPPESALLWSVVVQFLCFLTKGKDSPFCLEEETVG